MSRPTNGHGEHDELNGFASQESRGQVGESSSQGASPRKRKRFTHESLIEVFEGQRPEEKKELSRKFREMQRAADDSKANLANVTISELSKKLQKQRAIFGRVQDTGLAGLDSELILTTTEVAVGLARRMKIEGNAFDVDEFLLRVKGLLGLDRPEAEDQSDEDSDSQPRNGGGRRSEARKGRLGDWEKIGWMAAGLYRRVPGIEFMSGPILTTHVKRKIRRTARQKQLEPEVRPQIINQSRQEATQKDKYDTLNLVARVDKLLKKVDPTSKGVNFFKFVVNPDSFAQTVENCFFVSFLIRDGDAGIEINKDGKILLISKDKPDEERDGDIDKHQAVLEMDMETWEEAKRVHKITHPMIKHRDYSDDAPLANGAWYN